MESKEIDVRYVLGMTCEQFQSELGKEEPADMGYKEIELRQGWTIEDAMNELHKRAKDGNKYCAKFNTDTLTSDMSLDDAHMLILGMTYEQFQSELEKEEPTVK